MIFGGNAVNPRYLNAPTVPRYSHIRYTAFDRYGEPIDRTVDGFHVCVVQRECVHPIGTLKPLRVRDFTQFGVTEVLFPGIVIGELVGRHILSKRRAHDSVFWGGTTHGVSRAFLIIFKP